MKIRSLMLVAINLVAIVVLPVIITGCSASPVCQNCVEYKPPGTSDGGTTRPPCNPQIAEGGCRHGEQCLPTEAHAKDTGACTEQGLILVIRHTGTQPADIWCGGGNDPVQSVIPNVAPGTWTWCPVGVTRARTAANLPWEVCRTAGNGVLECTQVKDRDGFSNFTQ